jgi:putative glutamine amidotransferase
LTDISGKQECAPKERAFGVYFIKRGQMQPIIGITTYRKENEHDLPFVMVFEAYIQAVIQAGGVPVLIPSSLTRTGWQALYKDLDGILLAGGGDISLDQFDGDQHPRIDDVDSERDVLELNLLRAASEDGKPFLGICRGIQVVNVGLGGTLYTHIPDQHPDAIDHAYPGNMRKVLVHEVKVEQGSRFRKIVAEPKLSVNSLHHQGIKDAAPELRVTGYAPDGLVEAVELPGHPYGFAVQWHPEWLTDQKPTRSLFRSFIDAANQE